MYEFFKLHGATDEMIELAYDTNCNFGTSSHDVSALMMFFVDRFTTVQRDFEPVQLVAKGGNQRIPEAMASKLTSEVHLNKTVVGIRNNAADVEVICEDGSVYKASHVICSIPMPVLNHIKFDPILKGKQAKAVKTILYQPVTQVHVVPKEPFWEEDGLGTLMWTDRVCRVTSCLADLAKIPVKLPALPFGPAALKRVTWTALEKKGRKHG